MTRIGRYGSAVIIFVLTAMGLIAAPAIAERFGAGSLMADVLTSVDVRAQAAKKTEPDAKEKPLSPSATLTVTKTADTNDGVCDGDCSLREAVAVAAPGDSIVFASPLFDSAQTVMLNGQIIVDKSLTITGRGAYLTTVSNVAPAAATTRVFFVSGNPVTLSSMTISGGALNLVDPGSGCEICGGGILNTGNLTLTDMVFSGNNVTGTAINGLRSGGAVRSSQDSVLTIFNSTFTNNSVTGPGQNFGGAIYSAGTLRVYNSTITGNSVSTSGNGQGSGGGIVREGGTAVLINTTIASNTVSGASSVGDFCNGGGVFQSGNFFGDLSALNVIVANNTINNCQSSGPDFSGTLSSLGNNLIGNTAGANITGTTTGNILNQNPLLGPLGFYGGTVPTRPLTNNSPAVNAGNNCVTNLTCASNNPPSALTGDQRGAARVGNVDIGAFEVNNTLNGGTFRAILPSGRQQVAYTTTLVPNVGAFTTSNISSGAAPNGVALQLTGSTLNLVGTSSQSGTFNFGMSSTDGANTFTVDYSLVMANELIPPDTTITGTPTLLSNDPSPTFTFVGTDNTTVPGNMAFECSLDGAPFVACSSPQTYNGVADGPRAFAVRARDEAGNVDPTPATYSWTIETVPPAAPVIAAPADQSIVFVSQPTVTGTAEPNSTVTIYIDNVAAGTTSADGAGNWSRIVAFPVADGFRMVKATATDAAGNVSPETVNNFRIATVAPTIGAFASQTISVSGNAVYSPSVASTGAQYAIATTSSKFTGQLVVDPLNGNVRVTNAAPAGVYDVAVRVVNPFGSQTARFTLTVQTAPGCTTFDPAAFAPRSIHAAGPNAIGLAVGDFNGDGRQDIATANQNTSTVVVLIRNAANTNFEAPVTLNADLQPTNLAVADFNGDGKQDIASANFLGQTVSIFLRNVQNTGFEAPQNVPMNSFPAPGRQPYDVAAGDLNGDLLPDLVTANFNGSGISVGYRNAANTGFETFVEYATEALGRSVKIADFNGDGRNDIVVLTQLGTVSVFLRNSTNTDFEPRVSAGTGNSPTDLTVGDFNGDGRPDVAYVSNADSILRVVLRNSTNTGFDPVVTYPTGGLSRSVATGDFNNDGREDIVVSAESGVNVFLRNAANDGFSPFVAFNAGGLPWAAEIGDFNGDTRQDIAAVNFPDSTVSVLQRQCPVDVTPPDTTLLTTPNNPSNSSSATFTFIGTDNFDLPSALAFECSLDSAPFAACTSPQSYNGLADGNHLFRVRAKDSSANIDPTPEPFSWSVDATAPTVQLTSGAPDPTNAAFSVTATFSENVTGFDPSDVSVANGSAGNLAGGGSLYTFDVTPTAPGVVSVSVPANAAQDGAGNGSGVSNQLTRQFNNLSTLTVTKTADTNDGVCSPSDCSLREAISAATPGNTINFAPLFNSAQTIVLTNGELLISKNLTITGTGANLLTISGNNANRVFQLQGATVAMSGLTVTGGNADNGGGIFSFGSQLTIANSVVAGNVTSGNAGGIYNINGTLDLLNSTVSGNSATVIGGGIANGSGASVVNVTNSTISGNSASGGGGIFTNGAVTVRSSTITANSATNEGGGISNFTFDAVSLGNTIVAGNTAPVAPDFRDTLTSLGFNLIGNTSGTIITGDPTGNLLNQDARLLPLGIYGGPTQTHALLPGSPAINAGTSANATLTDQRGRARVGQVDIGAFEAQQSLIVTKTADTNDGTCDADCSLREAIAAAQANDSVQFASPLFDTPQTISLTLGELVVNKSLIVSGRGANRTTVSGSNNSRVFNVSGSGTNAVLEGLTVTGGRVGVNNQINLGGGILTNRTLTLLNCVVSGNTVSSNDVNYGGGIYNNGGTINLINTTLSGNTSTGPSNSVNKGGAIFNSGQLNIINSTLSGNSVTNGTSNLGGAIFMEFGSTVNMTNSTITANVVSGGGNAGGGILINSASVNARNSIISGNSSSLGPNVFGTLATNDTNIIGDEANVKLVPLGNYGGPTMTHALLSGSTAINAGNNCVLTQSCMSFNAPVALTTDQCGAGRVGNVDIGAFEVNNSANGGNYRATLPNGLVNTPYSFTLVPNNGTTNYSVTGGTLPNGINLTTNFAPSAVVAIAGTPTTGGLFNFSVTATDGVNSSVIDYALNIVAPTAAGVSVSGRVMTADGRGLRNATVRMTDANGMTRSARTGTFGYFRFEDVESGQVMTFNVKAKRANFAPRVVYVGDSISDLEFVEGVF